MRKKDYVGQKELSAPYNLLNLLEQRDTFKETTHILISVNSVIRATVIMNSTSSESSERFL